MHHFILILVVSCLSLFSTMALGSDHQKKDGEYEYVSGEGSSKRVETWKNGILINKRHYINSELNGYYDTYNEAGELILRVTFKNGLRHGSMYEYHSDGSIKKKQTFKNGILVKEVNKQFENVFESWRDTQVKQHNYVSDRDCNTQAVQERSDELIKKYGDGLLIGIPDISEVRFLTVHTNDDNIPDFVAVFQFIQCDGGKLTVGMIDEVLFSSDGTKFISEKNIVQNNLEPRYDGISWMRIDIQSSDDKQKLFGVVSSAIERCLPFMCNEYMEDEFQFDVVTREFKYGRSTIKNSFDD